MQEKSRRRVLRSVAATLGAISLAGCSTEINGADTDTSVSLPPEAVSDGLWTATDDSVVTFERNGLNGSGAVRTYQNTRVHTAIQKRFAGQFSQPLTIGFCINLEYEGLGATLVTAEELQTQIRPELENRLEKRGLTDFRELTAETWKSDDRPDPERQATGDAYSELLASYSTPEQTVSFSVDTFGEQTLTFPKREIPMRVPFFVRDLTLVGTSGEAYVAGGVYPTQNYVTEAKTALDRSEDASIDLTLRLNTGLDTRAIRRELTHEFIDEILEGVE